VQILLQLKGAGLVTSTRGAAGGYQLLRPPDELSLGEVMDVIEGPEGTATSSSTTDSPAARTLAAVWRKVADVEHEMLHTMTLAELVERLNYPHESMFHI
jgi:Rrf2 family protein